MGDEDGWREYQRLVLNELSKHEEALDEIQKQLTQCHIELASLQVRAGVWGLLAGLIPVLVVVGLRLVN